MLTEASTKIQKKSKNYFFSESQNIIHEYSFTFLTGFRKTRFKKKPNPGGFFWVLSVLGFIGFFWMHSASGCLNKHGKGK